jgi:hypothetical protein
MTDPIILQIASDSADAALFAAACAASDGWELESQLDGITDLTRCKQLMVALAGLFVRHVQAVTARTGDDATAWLDGLALEQLAVSKAMKAGE